jgi:hypothetical protein
MWIYLYLFDAKIDKNFSLSPKKIKKRYNKKKVFKELKILFFCSKT